MTFAERLDAAEDGEQFARVLHDLFRALHNNTDSPGTGVQVHTQKESESTQ